MPPPRSEGSDAYGQMLLAGLSGDHAVEIVERDDGFIDASVFGTALYLAPFVAGRRIIAAPCALCAAESWTSAAAEVV